MKILHVCQNYYPSKGGPQYTLKNVSEKLVSYYQDEVTVCTTNSLYAPESPLFKKIGPQADIINGVKINRLPFNRWHYPLIKYTNKALIKLTGLRLPYSIGKLRYTLDSPAINRAMKMADDDVIMATTISYDFCSYPLWRFKTSKPKPFVLYGAIHLHKKIENLQDPSLIKARACDCYISNTEFERSELINYGVQPHKVVNVGTGIEIDDFVGSIVQISEFKTKHNIKNSDIVIGFIGRLVKGKGVAILLDAFIKLYAENKNIKLLLAGGTTEYVAEAKKIVAELNLPVIIIEDFDDILKPVLYNIIDIFVLASQSESFGVVFLESWACKKPVIGTEMGAVASLVSDGEDGLLFKAGDVDSLAAKIDMLLKDESLRIKLGHAGYKKAQTQYSWPAIVKKYRDAYILGIENFKRDFKVE